MYRPGGLLERLKDGNRRFVEGRSAVRHTAEQRRRSLEGQEPWAIVVGCSDSRVPVEEVFDVGPGELFVVRTAGHVAATASLASIRFGIEALHVRAVVVLGHVDCGAVKAALTGGTPAWLAPIVDHIHVGDVRPPGVTGPPDVTSLAAAVDQHARQTVARLRVWLEQIELEDAAAVVGAAYELASGEVRWLDEGRTAP